MNILDAIQARQSIRSFKNKEVSKEIIENILNISKFAPSGGNTQPALENLCFKSWFDEKAWNFSFI